MRPRAFRELAATTLALCGVVVGCAAGGGADQLAGGDATGGTGGTAGDEPTGGTGDTGTGGNTTGGTGATSTGGATTGGTGSATGGAAPTGGTAGTPATGGTGTMPRPPGRATIALPYTDDFETSEAADWRFTLTPWTVTDDGGNQVLQLSSTSSSSEDTWAVGGDRNWTDVRVSMRVKFVSGDGMIMLSPKWRDLDNYAFVEYEAEDKPKLRRRLNGSTADIVTIEDTITLAIGQWHTVVVTLKGTAATLDFDGTVVSGTDSTPVPSGGIGIATEDCVVAIDDVSVTVPE
jgi:hypothetical protein